MGFFETLVIIQLSRNFLHLWNPKVCEGCETQPLDKSIATHCEIVDT